MPGGWGSRDDDPDARTLLEAENGRAQARFVRAWLLRIPLRGGDLTLTALDICIVNEIAMRGLLPAAGNLRTRSDLEIAWSKHVLPPHDQVPGLLAEACEFVNSRRAADPIFLASYILWRICWIHPFDDGNGRTARAVSYFILCQRLGFEVPGERPVPARIKQAPIAYTHALEAADKAWAAGRVDVSKMQELLGYYLLAQINDDLPGLPPGF